MVTFSTLTADGQQNAAASYQTQLVDPAPGSALVISIVTFETSNNQPNASAISGCGLTWSQVNQADHDPTGGDKGSTFLWQGVGTPSSGIITILFDAVVDRVSWVVTQVTDCDAVDPVVQSNFATVNAPSASTTLAAFTSPDNATFACFGVQVSGSTDTFTPEAGWTQGGVWHGASWYHNYTAFLAGVDTTPSGTFGDSRAAIIAAEIAAVIGGTPTTVAPVPAILSAQTPVPIARAAATLTPDPTVALIAVSVPTVRAGTLVVPNPVSIPLDAPVVVAHGRATVSSGPVEIPIDIPIPGTTSPTVIAVAPALVDIASSSPVPRAAAAVPAGPATVPIAEAEVGIHAAALILPESAAVLIAVPVPGVMTGPLVLVDISVTAGETRAASATVSPSRLGTVEAAATCADTAAADDTRTGTVEVDQARIGTVISAATRTGTAIAGTTRQGITVAPTRRDRN